MSGTGADGAAAAASTASGAAEEVHYFVKFANGLIGQTTTLLNDTVKGLHTIKKIEDMMADRAGWAALSEDERTQQLKVRSYLPPYLIPIYSLSTPYLLPI